MRLSSTYERRYAMSDLWRALGYLRKYWPVTLGAFASLLIVTLTSLISPQILQVLINRGISASNLSVIFYASLLILLVAGIRNLFTFTQGFWSEKASQSAAYEMRNAIFARLEHLSFSYYDQAQTGQLMTRVTSDVDTVRTFTGNGLLQLVNAIVMLLGSALILLLTNWRLALIVLTIVPAILSIFLFFLRRIGPRFRLVQQKLGNLNTILQENLAGVRVVKAFVREPYELARYRTANDDLLKENLTIVRGTSLSFPLIFFIANLATLAVIWFGGAQVIGGQLNIGELVAFNTYLTYLLLPVFILGSTLTSITQSAASAHRVFEVIDAPIEVSDKPGAIALTHLHGGVAFEDVSFRYAGSETLTLRNVSFVTKPGQTVAILGRTGSGKSSIINLIPRFYDVTDGKVKVDEYDVRDVTLVSLRSQIGIVLQETNLFSGTIRENIAYGRPGATQEEVESAARAAQAHSFITSFPTGYETVVGERGIGLSGGQRQRIAIARALLLNPSILILDDSTSAVDAETEYQIQQALQQLMANRTSFIIAQRISTIRNADHILLVDEGKLIAQGTHEELLRSSCQYAELLESQLLKANEEVSIA
jgi:ATP-binding cassette subfamily B multidrug efflux pump